MQESPVKAITPPAAYIGGKRNLAKRVCALIDSIPHHTYAEPFIGMGGIFLRRSHRARAEKINDISTDVVTLFRVLQEHYPYFIDMLRWRLASRAEFKRLIATDPDTLTALAEQLAAITGKFILSINDNPAVRALFAAFTLTPVSTTYTLSTKNKGGLSAAELIITNFPLPHPGAAAAAGAPPRAT